MSSIVLPAAHMMVVKPLFQFAVQAAASPFSWPMLAAMVGIFLPLVVAIGTRRSVRKDPVARVALGWAVLGVLDVVTLLQFLHPTPDPVRVITFAPPLAVVLFVPPLLRWLGSDAQRFTWPAFGLAAVLSAIGMALLGVDREFRAAAWPIANAMLSTLSVAALARCCWRAPGVPWRMDWFWVLTGMVVYFVVGIVWVPLAEFLVPRSWAAVVDLHMGMMLMQFGTYLLIARGAALRPIAQAEPPRWTTAASEVV